MMYNYALKATMSAGLATMMAATASAQSTPAQASSIVDIPERAIVVTGDKDKADRDMVAILYSREDMHFQDPNAPRFLFLDREGKLAFGIGGYVKGQAMYDFDGSIDDVGFTTYDIPVPANPAMRNALRGDATHSSIFMRLVGNTALGYLNVYFQTNFTGNDDSYGMQIKQAYVSLGNMTAGLARSTFVDASAQPPTIDTEGPSGATCTKDLLVRYSKKFGSGFSAAISAEIPKTSYTTNDLVESIPQRCPDIPAYVQYAWDGGNSHVRASGIVRNLSYRDLHELSNKWVTGWGAQLSGMWGFAPNTTLYYQMAYGKGIGQFINDTSGAGLDLIESTTPGKMEAPAVMGWLAGLQYNFSPKFFVSASYSQARVYDQSQLGGDAYRYAQYVVANGFYNILPDLQVGLEYNWGMRSNVNGQSGHANRISAAVQYSF